MYFEVVIEDELVKVYGLTQKEAVIGSSPQNNIILNTSGISKVHAKVFIHEGHWFIRDMNSTNGTYLENGEQLPSGDVALFKADETVRLGGHVYLRMLAVAPPGKIFPLNLMNVSLVKERLDQDKTNRIALSKVGLQQGSMTATKEEVEKRFKLKEKTRERRLKIKLSNIAITTVLLAAIAYRVGVYLNNKRLAEESKRKETLILKLKRAQAAQEKTIREAIGIEVDSKPNGASSEKEKVIKNPDEVVE